MKRKIAIVCPLSNPVIEFPAHYLEPSRKHCSGQLEEFALEIFQQAFHGRALIA